MDEAGQRRGFDRRGFNDASLSTYQMMGTSSECDTEVGAVFKRHPESELAQRERELGQIARLLEQQARSR